MVIYNLNIDWTEGVVRGVTDARGLGIDQRDHGHTVSPDLSNEQRRFPASRITQVAELTSSWRHVPGNLLGEPRYDLFSRARDAPGKQELHATTPNTFTTTGDVCCHLDPL